MRFIVSRLQWFLALVIAMLTGWFVQSLITATVILVRGDGHFTGNDGPLFQAVILSFYLNLYTTALYVAPALAIVLGGAEFFGLRPRVWLWAVLGLCVGAFVFIALNITVLPTEAAEYLANPGSYLFATPFVTGAAVFAFLRQQRSR